MINNQGHRICDAEIGSVKRGWRGCRRPAVATVASRVVIGLDLDYCLEHAPPAMRCNKCGRAMAGTTAYDGACACGGLIEAQT